MVNATVQRRAVRRAVRTECQAVAAHEFRLFGERVLDLSPRGMLVRCTRPARLGAEVIVSFRAPGPDTLWFEAEAVVARLIHGQRAADRGECAGLDFTYFEKCARHELLVRLAGLPPPVPERRLRTARERTHGSRQRMLFAEQPCRGSVTVHPVVQLWDEPVFPLVRRR
jgi:hypothetical protein